MKVLVPLDRVNHIVPYIPERCAQCDASLPAIVGPHDPEPTRFQVAELPELATIVTEHQGHARSCPCCGEVTRAAIPASIREHSIGPRLTAVLSYLVGVQGVSKRGVEEIAEQIFDTSISLGTVSNREQEMSQALASSHEEIRAAIASSSVKQVDETGWKQAGKKRWLWVAATASVVYFVIHPRRNLSALKRLVGETLAGILCSDRWCVYNDWPGRRQLCWAHMKRNWEKHGERGGVAQQLSEAWQKVQHQVFELWHLFRGGGCTREKMRERMMPLAMDLAIVLKAGRHCRDRKLVRFCERLTDQYIHLWTFLSVEGVEPTNNHAERVQRRAVLWRRRSFGCQSSEGCRFVERILTVVQTLKLQKRAVLEYLHQAILTHRAGQPSPRLLSE